MKLKNLLKTNITGTVVIVRFSRKGERPMEVEFPTEMDAYSFYADLKSGYREDDLTIEMEGEDNNENS